VRSPNAQALEDQAGRLIVLQGGAVSIRAVSSQQVFIPDEYPFQAGLADGRKRHPSE
jgi:hypothetical protein